MNKRKTLSIFYLLFFSFFIMFSSKLKAAEELIFSDFNIISNEKLNFVVVEKSGISYINKRNITFKLTTNTPNASFTICEMDASVSPHSIMDCTIYQMSDVVKEYETFTHQIKSYGDGEKTLRLYTVETNTPKNFVEGSSRQVILDTTGPKISLIDNSTIILEKDGKYKVSLYNLSDDYDENPVISVDDSSVNTSQYGKEFYVIYMAHDFLGNQTIVRQLVRIQDKPASMLSTAIIISIVLVVAIIIAVGLFQFFKIKKNKEKRIDNYLKEANEKKI